MRTASHKAPILQRALALHKGGHLHEAEKLYEEVLRLDPDDFDSLHMLGVIAAQTQRNGRAVQFLESAVSIREDVAEAYCNLAMALVAADRIEDSVEAYDRVIALAPARIDAYEVKATLLFELGRPQEARRAIEGALAQDRNNPSLLWWLSLCALKLGDYERGWKLYEWRNAFLSARGVYRVSRIRPDHLWTGSQNLAGRTLLVQSEQGLGDLIQFCRYIPLLESHGATVILSVQPKMRRLLRLLSSKTVLVSEDDPVPAADYDCLLLSLPMAVATTATSIPATVPYLTAEPELVAYWKGRIGSEGFKVGLCWQGRPGAADLGRSCPLIAFAPLCSIPGVRLFSLQKGAGSEQLTALPAGMRPENLGAELDLGQDAFVDTAAAMQALDLVITIDSAAAHLAGALGVRGWVALKLGHDWRWLLNREDSPWYPTLRLFRQATIKDWSSVVNAMCREVAAHVRTHASTVGSGSEPVEPG